MPGHKKIISNVVVYALLILIAALAVIPLWWMISTSLDRQAVARLPFPPRFWPEEFSTWGYYVTLRNMNILRYYVNTFIVAGGTILASLTTSMLAAYSFSKLRFKGYKICMMLIVCVLMVPTEVIMIPQYLIFVTLGLTDSYWALWLPGLCFVFGTFFGKKYMDSIPDSLREAAKIDGAGEFYIFSRIFLPLCKAIIATLSILLFLFAWNDLLWPMLILRTNSLHTIQIGLSVMTSDILQGFLPASHLAATLLSVVPVFIIYMILQRYIVASISMSGVKQ